MPLERHFMAVERVQRRLERVTAALDGAGIPYAVVGGNAVASWVARVDPSATRATKDVDILVRRADAAGVTAVITALGFAREDLRDRVLFIDPEEPSKRSGVHLVWAAEKIRPSYMELSPAVEEAVRSPDGFLVLDLPALVRMKLTSYRDIDRTHVRDLIEVGLVDGSWVGRLPGELGARLKALLDTPGG